MAFKDLTKEELVSLLEIIEAAQKCKEAAQVRELILNARGILEADYAICGLIAKDKSGLPAITSYVNGNYADEWIGRYMSERYFVNDPIVKHMSRFSLTRLWTDIFREYKDVTSGKLLKDAGDFDLRFGISGGVLVPCLDQIAVFTFAGGRDRFKDHHKQLLDIMILHLQNAFVNSVCATNDVSRDMGHGEF